MNIHEAREWMQFHVRSFPRNSHAFKFDFKPVKDEKVQHKVHKHGSLEMKRTRVLKWSYSLCVQEHEIKVPYTWKMTTLSLNWMMNITGSKVWHHPGTQKSQVPSRSATVWDQNLPVIKGSCWTAEINGHSKVQSLEKDRENTRSPTVSSYHQKITVTIRTWSSTKFKSAT